MIELTDEMVYAFAGEPEITATDAHAISVGLLAVLALVERDRCLAPAGHLSHPLTEPTVKVKWVCRRCGGPLSQCQTCKEPSLCGDSWCSQHIPDGES